MCEGLSQHLVLLTSVRCCCVPHYTLPLRAERTEDANTRVILVAKTVPPLTVEHPGDLSFPSGGTSCILPPSTGPPGQDYRVTTVFLSMVFWKDQLAELDARWAATTLLYR